MIVYKVVKKKMTGLYSCIATGKSRVRYRLKKWITSPGIDEGYGLLAFRTLRYAERFQLFNYCLGNLKIYKAEAEGKIINIPSKIIKSTSAVVWDNKFDPISLIKKEELYSQESIWPIGTVMLKKIKLLKRMNLC